MASGGKLAVLAALFGNAMVTVFKFIAAILSGSSSMFAEAYHSVSDTFNQVFLLIGIAKSKKKPCVLHPYGYGKEQFFWSFIVAMLIFGIAGVLSVNSGIAKLKHPEPITHVLLSYMALGFGFIFESFALYVAFKQLKKEMKKERLTSIKDAIIHSKDPTVLTVIFEDTLALLSIVLAAVGIGITWYTGNSFYDALTSIVIGALLMIFALVLARETKKLLIGESISNYKKDKIIKEIRKMKNVHWVMDFRTMHLGPEEVLVTIDINFRDDLVTNQVEEEVNKIERKIKKIIPKARVYVEAQELKKEMKLSKKKK